MVMARTYFSSEYVDMLKTLGAYGGSWHSAVALDAQQFPASRLPDHKDIACVKQWLLETGQLNLQWGVGGCAHGRKKNSCWRCISISIVILSPQDKSVLNPSKVWTDRHSFGVLHVATARG
jgi:hypothetical protein